MTPVRVTAAPDPADPFGTADLVAAVLATWTTSPARFREDANAEESLTHGYADRALIELAANAVDAARAADVPARIRVSTGTDPAGNPELRVANTGSPLTSAGVRALASLRASAKRDQPTVGHFGVGFTAVLGLTDAPRVISTAGGVQFSAQRTAEIVAAQDVPELTAELSARRGAIPTLRLCWPAVDPDPIPDGYVTEVRLPITATGPGPAKSDGAPDAAATVDRLIGQWNDAVVDHLMWALPDLQQVVLPDRTIDRRTGPDALVDLVIGPGGVAEPLPAKVTVYSFTEVARSGRLPADLLGQLPIEQRDRADWWIRWVLPEPGNPGVGRPGEPVAAPVCAPTPTDEQLTLPARLIGTFVVDDTRRHLTAGSITDFLLDRAVDGYLEMVASVPARRRPELVPPTGFPAGDYDARLRAEILRRWRTSPLLLTALGDPVSPSAAVAVRGLDADTTAALAQAIPGLLPPADSVGVAAQRSLGVSELPIGVAVDALASLNRPPEFWHQIYSGLAGFDLDAVAGLPVPLADGRQVIGARGLLLPEAGTAALAARAAAALPGLRMVHPQAVHPLLERLGAEPADADAVLTSPALVDEIAALAADLEDGGIEPDELSEGAVRTYAAGSPVAITSGDVPSEPPNGDLIDGMAALDRPGPAALVALVLDLIAAGGRGDPAVLADLVLTADDGEPWPAGGLLLPGSPLRPLISDDDLPTVHRQWVELWDPESLTNVGVRRSVLLISTADPRAGDLLPDLDDYLDQADDSGSRADPDSPEVTDLDLIDESEWPAFLALLAADPAGRAAVLAGGYTSWWLRGRVRFDGRPPNVLRLAQATDLAGLVEPLPEEIGLDPALAAAIGILTDLDSAIDRQPQLLLDRFCDPDRALPVARIRTLTARLAAALANRTDLQLPPTVRTLAGTVRDADDVAVPDGPWWAQVRGADALLAPGSDPATTAGAFEVDLASERWGVSGLDPERAPSSADVQRWASGVAAGLGIEPGELPDLRVRPGLALGVDGTQIKVGWWPDQDGILIDGTAPAVADAIAWATGRWPDRHVARAAVLADPDRELIESAFG